MRKIIVTGSAGLIGSESARHFAREGYRVIGIDNDMRSQFFGPEASTQKTRDDLVRTVRAYEHHDLDIRAAEKVSALFREQGNQIAAVIHTAAQPSHDWAARDPQTDFTVNANGTLNLLEAAREYCPEAPFVFTSTNKVYMATRQTACPCENFPALGNRRRPRTRTRHLRNDEHRSHTKHSLFGASKAAADLLVQEYGRYFGMPTVCFRGGCLTGPAHSNT